MKIQIEHNGVTRILKSIIPEHNSQLYIKEYTTDDELLDGMEYYIGKVLSLVDISEWDTFIDLENDNETVIISKKPKNILWGAETTLAKLTIVY